MSFRALHRSGDPFILANAWDRGSALMLTALGAPAIATSSAAHAFTLGRPDMGSVTRDEALAHAQDLLSVVNVPVSGDFENGFGDTPEDCAETVRLAGEIGLSGISIEDTALPTDTPYDRELAVERIRAAAAAARGLKADCVLTARADGVMLGQYALDEAIARIQAYEVAGADCVYIPVPPAFRDLDTICKATRLPVNALIAEFTQHSLADFAKMGVARLSLGSSLARATHRLIHDTARGMFEHGDFSLLGRSIPGDVVDELLTGPSQT